MAISNRTVSSRAAPINHCLVSTSNGSNSAIHKSTPRRWARSGDSRYRNGPRGCRMIPTTQILNTNRRSMWSRALRPQLWSTRSRGGSRCSREVRGHHQQPGRRSAPSRAAIVSTAVTLEIRQTGRGFSKWPATWEQYQTAPASSDAGPWTAMAIRAASTVTPPRRRRRRNRLRSARTIPISCSPLSTARRRPTCRNRRLSHRPPRKTPSLICRSPRITARPCRLSRPDKSSARWAKAGRPRRRSSRRRARRRKNVCGGLIWGAGLNLLYRAANAPFAAGNALMYGGAELANQITGDPRAGRDFIMGAQIAPTARTGLPSVDLVPRPKSPPVEPRRAASFRE